MRCRTCTLSACRGADVDARFLTAAGCVCVLTIGGEKLSTPSKSATGTLSFEGATGREIGTAPDGRASARERTQTNANSVAPFLLQTCCCYRHKNNTYTSIYSLNLYRVTNVHSARAQWFLNSIKQSTTAVKCTSKTQKENTGTLPRVRRSAQPYIVSIIIRQHIRMYNK